eukprot:GFUD01009063.1.p1 GENE.GFUD01009063.1~~GFUD01009063.1.p1  ORF type:complete len:458 (-),score=83.36 GFUD01009063.1:40-1413(-)
MGNICDLVDWGRNRGVKIRIAVIICIVIISIIIAIIIICCNYTYYRGKCQVDLTTLTGDFPPLLVQNGNIKLAFSENEEGNPILSFVGGDTLTLVCHGSRRRQSSTFLVGETHERDLRLVCSDGEFLREDGLKVLVEAASCNRRQEPVIIRKKEECSPVGADGRTEELSSLVRVAIGWDIDDNFIEQIGLCHDEFLYATIWAKYTMHGANIAFRDSDSTRPVFRADTNRNHRFFNWTLKSKMDQYYSKRYQLEQVKQILKTNNKFGDENIIDTSRSGTTYLARGHLAPDAAFLYHVLQDATYYFVNVAPQFQSFNNGNWRSLEFHIRELAIKLGRDLRIVTGTHGILEYPNKIQILTPIFLFNSSFIPVPEYYWKLVQDPQTNKAAVFIGLNNPHTRTAPTELCTNRCGDMAWVDWDVEDLSAGYMYCCTLQEARKHLPEIPELGADGGLLGMGDVQ